MPGGGGGVTCDKKQPAPMRCFKISPCSNAAKPQLSTGGGEGCIPFQGILSRRRRVENEHIEKVI